MNIKSLFFCRNYNFKSIIFIETIVLLFSIMAKSGAGSSGGASVVLTTNCRVILTDFFDSIEPQPPVLSQDERNKCFWSNKISNQSPLISDLSFLEAVKKDTLNLLDHYQVKYPVFKALIDRNKLSSDATFYSLSNLNLTDREIYLSPRLNENIQEPLVYYSRGLKIIIGPLFEKLDFNSQIAAFLHEEFRNLNYYKLLQSTLTTEQIELSVRHFLNKEFKGDHFESIHKILKEINPIYLEELKKDPEHGFENYINNNNLPVNFSPIDNNLQNKYFEILVTEFTRSWPQVNDPLCWNLQTSELAPCK